MKKLLMGLVIAFLSLAVLGVSGCETAQQKRARAQAKAQRAAEINRIKCGPERRAKKVEPGGMGPGSDSVLDIFLVTSAVGTTTTWAGSKSTEGSAKSSGTKGCKKTTKKTGFYLQQQEFVAFTIDNLSEQIAQGGGPHLQSLSALLGCPASDYSKLAIMTRQNYGQLFPSAETEPEVFLIRLKDKMRDNPSLADRCVNI